MDNYFSKTLRRLADELDSLFSHQKIDQKLIADRVIASDYGSSPGELKADPVPDGMDPDLFMEIVEALDWFDHLNVDPKTGPKNRTTLKTEKCAGKGAEKQSYIDINKRRTGGYQKEDPLMRIPKLLRGSITQRTDGRFMVRYYQNGVLRPAIYARTKLEVIVKANKVIQEDLETSGNAPMPKKMTLTAWFSKWITVYKVGKLRESSISNLRSVAKPLLEMIGKKEVSKITAYEIETSLGKIPAPMTRLRSYMAMKECLDSLVKNRTIKENPFDFVDRPEKPKPKKKMVPSSTRLPEVLERLREQSPKYALLAEFSAFTGLRVGEIFGLTWSDVDPLGWIHVTKAYERVSKKIASPKTESSVRDVPLFPEARRVLDEIGWGRANDGIFSFIGKTAYVHNFSLAATKAGFPGLSVHSFRHYFASWLKEKGVDEKIRRLWLGHTKPETTDRYTHVSPEFEQIQIMKMAK